MAVAGIVLIALKLSGRRFGDFVTRERHRTFLLNALDNFVISELRKQAVRSRRPEGGMVSLAELQVEDFGPSEAGQADSFTQEWARAVLAEALSRMRRECEIKGCLDRWGLFEARLIDPELNGGAVLGYTELVKRFGFASPDEAQNALVTAKRQFARILRRVVAEYAGDNADVAEELRDLMRALSG